MKCHIPQISWHGRDPVLSIDFQKNQGDIRRLATGGTDSHVLIWYVSLTQHNSISLEFASDLNRHTRPVNVVRFSPNGEILASGDDEAAIILWNKQDREVPEFNEEESENKEYWAPIKVLRGHLDDICDISWSPDSNFLYSGSIDNSAIIWDIQKGKKATIFTESKGFVQGVAWDPLNQCLASLSSDRTLRIHNINNKRVMFKVQKAVLNPSTEQAVVNKPVRIFYDDTLKSFCRRLTFSPDGELLIVPSGIIEQEDGKFQNTTYVFVRHALNKPVLHYPTGNKYSLAVRCSPILYKLREPESCKKTDSTENTTETISLFSLPYRIIIAIATEDSIFFYDTQQLLPFAFVSNIHYTHLTDLAWSSDGHILIASSTDGYCSFVIFNEGELGEPYNQMHSSYVDEDLSTSKECEGNTPTSAAADQDKIIKEKIQLKDTNNKMDIDYPAFSEKKLCHNAVVSNLCSKSDIVKEEKDTELFNSLVLNCTKSNDESVCNVSAVNVDHTTLEKKPSDFLNENKCVKPKVTYFNKAKNNNCNDIKLKQADSSPKIKNEMSSFSEIINTQQEVIKYDPEEKQNQERISNVHTPAAAKTQEEMMDCDDRNYEDLDIIHVAKSEFDVKLNAAGNINTNVSESNTEKEIIKKEQFEISVNNLITDSNKPITSSSSKSQEKTEQLDITTDNSSSDSKVHVAKQETSMEIISLIIKSEDWDLKLEPSCDHIITDTKEKYEKTSVLQAIKTESKSGMAKNEKKAGRRVQLITVAGPKVPKS